MTLDTGNITWLKGRAGAIGESVSEILDQVVTAARQGKALGRAQSVVGTIDIDPSDSSLKDADALVKAMFDRSIAKPLVARERRPRG